MKSSRVLSKLIMLAAIAAPTAILLNQTAAAQGSAVRPQWQAPKSKKATPKTAPKTATLAPTAASTSEPTVTPPESPATVPAEAPAAPAQATSLPVTPPVVVDQSQEVLDIDFALAASVASIGPKLAYGGALSEVGVLYDANGASPTGVEAANTRFATFPADVTFVRVPESALAAGGSGSSWGSYSIKRGETLLSGGRYISVWRREPTGWKMISELAAGKAPGAPAGSSGNAVLPKRPVSLRRPAGPSASVSPPATNPTNPAPPVTPPS